MGNDPRDQKLEQDQAVDHKARFGICIAPGPHPLSKGWLDNVHFHFALELVALFQCA